MDLSITWNLDQGDLVMGAYDLATDAGLPGSIYNSLATDRLADADDEIPDGTTDRRGCWIDSFPDVPGDLQGSRLWIWRRSKDVPETYLKVNEVCEEALQWLLDDGVASSFTVNSFRVAFGVIGITVQIFKPSATQPINYAYQFAWEGF